MVRPVSASTDYLSINTAVAGAGTMVSFIESTGFAMERVFAAGLDRDGNLVWNPTESEITSGNSARARLVCTVIGDSGDAALLWQEGDIGQSDIYAQAINMTSGSVGVYALNLTITGTCPGRMTFTITKAMPGARLALVYATGEGSVIIPGGYPCEGLPLCLNGSVKLGTTLRADQNGMAQISTKIPGPACNGRVLVEAIDLSRCVTSAVVPMP